MFFYQCKFIILFIFFLYVFLKINGGIFYESDVYILDYNLDEVYVNCSEKDCIFQENIISFICYYRNELCLDDICLKLYKIL